MDQDRYFVRQLGCQWLGPEYDSIKWYRDNPGLPTPYCGCKELHGDSVYCKEHYPKMYAKGTALRKRKKDARKAQAIADLQQLILDIAEELEDSGWTPEQERELGFESVHDGDAVEA